MFEEGLRGAVAMTAPAATPNRKLTKLELQQLLDKGVGYHRKGLVKQAMECYRELLIQDISNKAALYYTAIALSQQNKPQEQVLAIMEDACKHFDKVPEAHFNLGVLLHRMGREEDAIARFERALKLDPGATEARMSLAGAYLNMGRRLEGEEQMLRCAKSISQKPDAVYSRAFARLTCEMFQAGWTDYDIRWQTSSFLVENRRDFGGARFWGGANRFKSEGKVIYVHTEQGAGDVLMMSRFLAQVAALSKATIVFEVGGALMSLMKGVPGVDYVIETNTPVPNEVKTIDYFLPMMSIPRQLGIYKTSLVPSAAGWVKTPNSSVVVPVSDRPKIGIAWAGSSAHKNDRYRTLPWAFWRDQLLRDPRFAGQVDWYSFQVGEHARQMDDGGSELGVKDLTPNLKTFADTAAGLAQMDALVSVDTSTVHTAAALKEGPPTFMLVPAAPDWRWSLRGECYWYDRVKLFRQDLHTDWVTPLGQLKDALVTFIQERAHAHAQ